MAYTDIDKPSDYFVTNLHTGNGGTQTISGLDFQPDFLWIKDRGSASSHYLCDSVRGSTKRLRSDTDVAEVTLTNAVTSFTSDGFAMGDHGAVNSDTSPYAAWSWKKTATAGFDIVSYSGNNSTNRQISHSLSAKPDMMLVKCRQAGLWKIYHSSLGATKYLVLSDNAGVVDNNSTWNDTEPTSSNFTLGDDGNVNETGETYINYLFAEKKGYSKFGSYVGNGNANGTFVYTGQKSAFIMLKNTTRAASWLMFDNKRLGYNVDNNEVVANTSAAEETYDQLDFLSNGFKMRTNGTSINLNGDTYIYMCFADNPFTTSTGVPATAK